MRTEGASLRSSMFVQGPGWHSTCRPSPCWHEIHRIATNGVKI